MKGPELLRANVGRIRTRMGACFVGSHAVFRGHDLHAELGDLEWTALYLLGITGRRFTDAQVRLLQALWVYTSYPDACIWNNRVAALAGTTRSTGNLGVSAALALSEGAIYGRGIDIRAIDFLIRTRAHLEGGGALEPWVREELERRRSLAGYGRPVAQGDERIQPFLRLAESLGLGGGPYMALAFRIERALLDARLRLHINYGAVAAAAGADQGLSPREYYLFTYPTFLAGMIPCYVEAAERPEGTVLPLPCAAVACQGAPRRPWRGREVV